MHMPGGPHDVAEHRLLRPHLLAHPDERADVPVLELAPAARIHPDPLPWDVDDRHGAVGDGIDGGAVRSGDVDALVERGLSGSVQYRGEGRRPEKLRPRIAEVAPD